MWNRIKEKILAFMFSISDAATSAYYEVTERLIDLRDKVKGFFKSL